MTKFFKLIEKIYKCWLINIKNIHLNDFLIYLVRKMDFDVLITTPEHIRDLAPVAKQLGPKGLMPSPKAGTVAMNISQAVEEVKKWKIEFRLDKTGNIHAGVGKVSFDDAKLVDNINALLTAIEENKPTGVKGKLVKKVVLSTTMSPAVVIAY